MSNSILEKGGRDNVRPGRRLRQRRAFSPASAGARRAAALRPLHAQRTGGAGDMGLSRHAGGKGLSPAALGVHHRPFPLRGRDAAVSRCGERPRRADAQRPGRVEDPRPQPQRRRVSQRRARSGRRAGGGRGHSPLHHTHAEVLRRDRGAPRPAGAAAHCGGLEDRPRRDAVFPHAVSASARAGVHRLRRPGEPAQHHSRLLCADSGRMVLLHPHAHDGPLRL